MGGAFARLFADNIAAIQHILDDIMSNANDFDQQERVLKSVLRADSSLLIHSLTRPLSANVAAGVPALAKLHAINHVTSQVVAAELLKETGQEDELAVTALAAALPSSTLLGFLDGSRLNVAHLLICYNAYKQPLLDFKLKIFWLWWILLQQLKKLYHLLSFSSFTSACSS
jgi:hypothetical protein